MRNQPEIRLHQSCSWLDADTETPISLYLKLIGDRDGILLESAEVDGRWGRYSILGCNILLYASCENGRLKVNIHDDRLENLQKYQDLPFIEGLRNLMNDIEIVNTEENLPPITRALYGYLGFGMASIFNPHLQGVMPENDAKAELALPGTLLVFDHLYNRLCQLDISGKFSFTENIMRDEAGGKVTGSVSSCPDEEGYKEFVRNIREKLRNGEAIQVVPSVRFCAPFTGSAFSIYRRLRKLNPSPYMFFMHFPNITLFGSSPEVMVSCSENELSLSPIAGTRKRGKNTQEDKKLSEELLADPKDRAEHVMLVDLGRNDLGRIARPGSVNVREYMQIQRFSHVMHLTSEIVAGLKLKNEEGRYNDALDVLAATFPAGTVSGAPKFRAMEIIRELENADRGPYAGCIGWIGLDKDSVNMDMGITIRSMWEENGHICWQAGGGIVHDSDPDLEWQEVRNKSAIMRQVLNIEENNVSDN